MLDSIFSEGYSYDNLNQLTTFSRNTGHSQSFVPDALGNFTSVVTDGTTQTRTANQQNEITSISARAVTYDADGNTTADGSGNTYVYDAWDRLVRVVNNGTTVASYGYNGLGERITETHGTTTTDLYYSAAWQVLEERVVARPRPATSGRRSTSTPWCCATSRARTTACWTSGCTCSRTPTAMSRRWWTPAAT